VERWRLKRQFSEFEEPVSEYGHPNDRDAQSDGYGRGRPNAMKNFSHGVLLFLFDTPSHDGSAVADRMPSSAGSAFTMVTMLVWAISYIDLQHNFATLSQKHGN
jgi:hypothetical protein